MFGKCTLSQAWVHWLAWFRGLVSPVLQFSLYKRQDPKLCFGFVNSLVAGFKRRKVIERTSHALSFPRCRKLAWSMRLPQRQPGRLAILTDGFFRQQSGRHRTSKKCRHRIHLGSVQYGAILGSDVVTGARRVLVVVGRLASTSIYTTSLHTTIRFWVTLMPPDLSMGRF